jgi:transposase
LDSHKESIQVAMLLPGETKPVEWQAANDAATVSRMVKKVRRQAPGEARFCYEAGPCGYALQRWIRALGVTCVVVAPSLIPRKSGERIKTDRRDARKLAELYRACLLAEVHPPTEADEAVRDLCRAREDAHDDLIRNRHRVTKLLLRRGHSWAEPVGAPRCFRGIDTITAMTIVAELHSFMRFHSPRGLMAYLGLVPSEHSSGGKRRQGGLTLAGNSHVRRLLIESAWHYRHRPSVANLARRRRGQPPRVIALADKAMYRLHRRFNRMLAKGKPRPKIVAAVARELVGFVWATLPSTATPAMI